MRAASHVELQAPLAFGPLHLELCLVKAARPRRCHAADETPQPNMMSPPELIEYSIIMFEAVTKK
jgi:hypothetical protein